MEYSREQDSKSCYLDGRYFNMVLADYPGLIKEPMYIVIKQIKSYNTKSLREKVYVNIKPVQPDTKHPGILRLIIDTPKGRHCNLLILDYESGTLFRFEPLGNTETYFSKVNDLLEDVFPDFELDNIHVDFEDTVLDEKNPNCRTSGFCTAYVLKYALAFISGKDYDPHSIRKFVAHVERKFGPLPKGNEEIEYGNRGYGGGYGGHHGYGGRSYYYNSPFVGGFGYPGYGLGVPYYGYGYPYPYYGGYGGNIAPIVATGLLAGALASAV